MMFIPLIILFSVSGILCDPFDCARKKGKTCGEIPIPKGIPESAEELRAVCNTLGTFGRCTINVLESCRFPEEIFSEIREKLDFINSVCDEDNPIYKEINPVMRKSGISVNCSHVLSSPLHESVPEHNVSVISKNIECIAPVAMKLDDTCNQLEVSEENFELAANHEMEISNNYTREDMQECLMPFWQVSCKSIVMGLRCGSEVKEAVHDILTKMQESYQKCTSEILEELQPLYETFEFIIEAELKFKNALKKRK